MKCSLITVITGQSGSYLAEFILAKGYEVHGIARRTALFNTTWVDPIQELEKKPRCYQARPPGSMAWCRRFNSVRPSPVRPMPWPMCKPTGSTSTTAMPMDSACNGIFFNHESPKRGESFVTRMICPIATAQQNCLLLGNMNALRDWGHPRDYVERQHEKPYDFVIAPEVHRSVELSTWEAEAEKAVPSSPATRYLRSSEAAGEYFNPHDLGKLNKANETVVYAKNRSQELLRFGDQQCKKLSRYLESNRLINNIVNY